MIAAGAPMVPLSAAPLTPSGINGAGAILRDLSLGNDVDRRRLLVREGDGERLSASGVVSHQFAQRSADGSASAAIADALPLAFERRVHRTRAIMPLMTRRSPRASVKIASFGRTLPFFGAHPPERCAEVARGPR
jgi:hypothetical protein